jgi:hypothetical protein
MITVTTVEWNNYQNSPDTYINRLGSSVARHLKQEHRYEPLRLDDSPLPGWFRKLEIFRPGRFTGRVLYLDLDSLIVGPLDALVEHKGAVHLKDWGWEKDIVFGGVWVFDAEVEGKKIWDAYTPKVAEQFADDQQWLTTLGVFDRLPKGAVVSYRYHSKQGAPSGASVIAFHGAPKIAEVKDNWVQEAWR